MDVVSDVYRLTANWPKEELYGLTNQLRRAAVSVPANIAEGQGCTGKREFLHHLSIANGSLHEAETLLLIAHDLRFVDKNTCDELLGRTAEVGRLINGLIRRLRESLG